MKIILASSLAFLLAACQQKRAGHTNHNNSDTTTAHSGMSHPSGNNAYIDAVNAGQLNDTLKGSPERTAMATINGTHVHITYHSPGVKGRVIWGGLVPYDQVWVTGAHHATKIDFSKAVSINGKTVAAGTYAFFTIPGKTGWQLILNTHHEQHLTDSYHQEQDVLRMKVQPDTLFTAVPRLTYLVEKAGENQGRISMSWDSLKVTLPFTTTENP